MSRKLRGFTLIELLVVIGIIAILAAVVIIALNPARQFAQARNTQRWSNVNTVLNAVGQRIADNRGVFQTGCAAGAVPTAATNMGVGAGNYDVAPCLVPTYVSVMPFDPNPTSTCTAYYTDNTAYNTCYNIQRDATTGRITISAPSVELAETISVTR